jgi:hypothetical protein
VNSVQFRYDWIAVNRPAVLAQTDFLEVVDDTAVKAGK